MMSSGLIEVVNISGIYIYVNHPIIRSHSLSLSHIVLSPQSRWWPSWSILLCFFRLPTFVLSLRLSFHPFPIRAINTTEESSSLETLKRIYKEGWKRWKGKRSAESWHKHQKCIKIERASRKDASSASSNSVSWQYMASSILQIEKVITVP